MKIEYWRKNFVPNNCPKCGATKDDLSRANTLNELLTIAFDRWTGTLEIHPKWKIPCWYGNCGRCVVNKAMKEPDWIPGPSKFYIEEYEIPFRTKDKE